MNILRSIASTVLAITIVAECLVIRGLRDRLMSAEADIAALHRDMKTVSSSLFSTCDILSQVNGRLSRTETFLNRTYRERMSSEIIFGPVSSVRTNNIIHAEVK